MKIATFNINNVNRRLPNLLRWLKSAKPDVVSLQELKASDAELSQRAVELKRAIAKKKAAEPVAAAS